MPFHEHYMDVWMKGSRFRVRDESGQHVGSILADLSASNGLGASPDSMEEIMDIWSQSRNAKTAVLGPTDLYGDLATNEGWVRQWKQDPWPIAAEKLAPAAEQILAGKLDTQLQQRGQVTCLGRQCIKYEGFLAGEDQGIPYKSAVTRTVSPPYLLSSIVSDSKNAEHYYTREIVALEEGVASDADLTPPIPK